MFKKILIANRGEIACRVIKTARKMGIKTVAVYSEADRRALHVEMADEAVFIGKAPSAESYLVIDNIVRAIKETGADAVHPGYGFLSENTSFAKRLKKEKVTFIGPPPEAITAMGDKIESKKLAMKAGVNTIPGHTGVVKDADHAVKIAQEVGYPVMIKASAGGGGKGMRIARNDKEAREGFASASREAKSSFGDDRVFIERYIEEPRHIEIQVLADGHGNVLYLGERECSIQRRHQKVLEEAPSPFLDAKTRKAMGEQAVALARAVGYRSAGTVEFIVDTQRNFFFLEMNTRLQVEHPVTELVTGLDLVEQMIRVAAGEELPLRQKDVKLKGWALEARVYAEDPFRGFLPSTGRLVRYRPPAESASVRVDTGVCEGGEISMFYDPMIAKLCSYGRDRDEAIANMRHALDQFFITGVSHNIGFLAALVTHPRFEEGRLSTNFIAEEYPDGFHAADVPHDNPLMLVAVAAAMHYAYQERAARISGQVPGFERKVAADWNVRMGGDSHPVTVAAAAAGFRVKTHRQTFDIVSDWKVGEPLFHATVNGEPACLQVDRLNVGYRLRHRGTQAEALVMSAATAALQGLMPKKLPPDLSRFLMSPMPGLLVSLAVKEGQEVKAGDPLAVIEAMKMENVLRAERDGTIGILHAKSGDSLAVDQKILEFK
ncbi:MAG: acetyl-CoA carboxylase biotin carboxylase subunit [Magnetospirillum sp. WYHS-4]